MEQILVYSDSLTWGIIPNTRNRLPFEQRWPGVLERKLLNRGKSIRVIENCLNGRRTAWSDPFKKGRDGSQSLAQVIEMNSPLKLVILMLGTNDFQCVHHNNAWHSAQGMAKLVNIIKQSPIEPGMPIPGILIVSPPTIVEPKGDIAVKFKGAGERYIGLPEALKQLAFELNVSYFDANWVTESSQVDGIHLDAPQHEILGAAIAKAVISEGFF
jgi:lysophospholipase L1-like esterase